jgi:hypothetical protein
MEERYVLSEAVIKKKIHSVRNLQVMLDSDLAQLYGVQTKQLNRAVKRNTDRFPENFCFQLTAEEFDALDLQFMASYSKSDLRFQNGTSNQSHGGRRYLPYVFTEQGVAMLSGVLRSKVAVKISIQIMQAFVAMRRLVSGSIEIFNRLDLVEKKQLEYDKKFELVFDAIQNNDIKPQKGIFFSGQIFDAHKFVSDLIRSAKKSIVLIDNFVDESVLALFTKRNENISVTIYTRTISNELKLDLEKYNSQYPEIKIKEFNDSHDRFMIIDEMDVYHIGASLKDLGKKWFAFSRFEKTALALLSRLD